MLGKTNLTKVEKGNIVADIEDYRWDAAGIDGITGNFIKTLYANNILIGITVNGTIAYTKDGENWEIKKIELDNGDFFEFTDITYGNGKYVIVGYHRDSENYIHGLIVITEDFAEFEILMNWHSEENSLLYEKIMAVTEINNTFIMYVVRPYRSSSSSLQWYVFPYLVVMNDIKNSVESHRVGNIANVPYYSSGTTSAKPFEVINGYSLKLAKKSDGALLCYIRYGAVAHEVTISKDGRMSKSFTSYSLSDAAANPTYADDLFNLFECKDNLYFAANTTDFKYKISKIVGDSEALTLSEDIAYGFIDAAYFNKCEIFVNNHEMLVVRPGESIADKTLSDLVEITYDFSITSIVKAFDKLYVFGTDGNILVSNDENNGEESLAVRTMSASKALYEAKAYTDKRIEELRAELTSGA